MSTPTVQAAELDPAKEAQLNRDLIDSIIAADSGELKQASSAGSKMIRRRIRENGFSRRIIPPVPVQDNQLTRLPDTEFPSVVEDHNLSPRNSPARHRAL